MDRSVQQASSDRPNIDPKTVAGFGEEWHAFSQEKLDPAEQRRAFGEYFSVFPFDDLPADSEGFDLGCGTGRWAALAAERVGLLHCIDPAAKALEVARRRLSGLGNVTFHLAGVDDIPLADGSQDFGYALGVLHHIPNTEAAMASCVRKLKSGAPFLAYIYYAFDNRPFWYRALWGATDIGRSIVSRMPFLLRKQVSALIAAGIYLPAAKFAAFMERKGHDVANYPLSFYRDRSFYSMRTDALDRFGTRLEQRFTRREIEQMMMRCGLVDIRFREAAPYWVACGRKAAA